MLLVGLPNAWRRSATKWKRKLLGASAERSHSQWHKWLLFQPFGCNGKQQKSNNNMCIASSVVKIGSRPNFLSISDCWSFFLRPSPNNLTPGRGIWNLWGQNICARLLTPIDCVTFRAVGTRHPWFCSHLKVLRGLHAVAFILTVSVARTWGVSLTWCAKLTSDKKMSHSSFTHIHQCFKGNSFHF